MTHLFNLAFVILCVSVGIIWTAEPEVSYPQIFVSESNVPNVMFEADAQQALQEAYALFPSDHQRRIETFAGLFGNLHHENPGWNVAEGCSIHYRSLKAYTYVSLNVTINDNETTIVKIYN